MNVTFIMKKKIPSFLCIFTQLNFFNVCKSLLVKNKAAECIKYLWKCQQPLLSIWLNSL